MKNRKKKQIGFGIVIILLVIGGIAQFRVKTVEQYKDEQEILIQNDLQKKDSNNAAQEENSETEEPVSTNAIAVAEMETSKTEQKTERKKTSSKGEMQSKTKESKKKSELSKIEEVKKESVLSTKEESKKESVPSKTKEPKKESTPVKTEKIKSDSKNEKKTITCKLVIDCSALEGNMDQLGEQMQSYIPSDGMILESTSISVEEGQSAYDILAKGCKMYDIALDAEYTTLYSGYYVKGIGYLYEKQAGDMSGWFYQVNGKTPNVGACAYTLSDGDEVTWVYSCSGRVGS